MAEGDRLYLSRARLGRRPFVGKSSPIRNWKNRGGRHVGTRAADDSYRDPIYQDSCRDWRLEQSRGYNFPSPYAIAPSTNVLNPLVAGISRAYRASVTASS